jgi:hypothetical protein
MSVAPSGGSSIRGTPLAFDPFQLVFIAHRVQVNSQLLSHRNVKTLTSKFVRAGYP